MPSIQLFSCVLFAAALTTQVVMLTLQVRAFRRHGHQSFFLLSIATVCGVFYLALSFAIAWWLGGWTTAGVALYSVASLLALVQMTLGIWGTASLFRSYGRLASQRSPTGDVAVAPN